MVGIWGSITYLKKHFKEWMNDALKDRFDAVDSNLKQLSTRIDNVDLAACKNYLVTCLSKVDKGPLDEIELERFWEEYEHYVDHGGNSYIKSKVEKLQQEGKL